MMRLLQHLWGGNSRNVVKGRFGEGPCQGKQEKLGLGALHVTDVRDSLYQFHSCTGWGGGWPNSVAIAPDQLTLFSAYSKNISKYTFRKNYVFRVQFLKRVLLSRRYSRLQNSQGIIVAIILIGGLYLL